jgi:uncharacterized integral membrane protein (TIGR00698 family)
LTHDEKPSRALPGLLLSALLGLLAVAASSWPPLQHHGISALTVAIVAGILAGNTIYPRMEPWAGCGVAVARQTVLRTGVVLYGFRLTLQDIAHVGWSGVLIDATMLVSTFAIACLVGTRLLRLDRASAMLVGAGSAICGAAAVLAAEPVVRGRPEQASIAVASVVLFGTAAMFLYPLLAELNAAWHVIPGGAGQFGIYIGATVHEVAQVVASARQVGPDAAGPAVISKMVRVMMLAPFLVALAAWLRSSTAPAADQSCGEAMPAQRTGGIPPFAFLFVGVVLFNSLGLLPARLVDAINVIGMFLLAAAMGALGLSTQFATVRRCGGKALLLALLLFVWLVAGGAVVTRAVFLAAGHP